MSILIGILLGFGLLAYFLVFKKPKTTGPVNYGGENTNQVICKKYKVKITDTSKVENLAWVECNNELKGGVVEDGLEFCAKSIIYHNPTNLELIESGIC